MQTTLMKVAGDGDLDSAFGRIVASGAGAVLLGGGPFLLANRERIVGLAARHALPMVYELREYVELGGLISYSASFPGAYRQAGGYAGRILKGTKPSELPILRRNYTNLLAINTGVNMAAEGVRMNGIGKNGVSYTVDGTDAGGAPAGTVLLVNWARSVVCGPAGNPLSRQRERCRYVNGGIKGGTGKSVVVSSAVDESNPEVSAARERGIRADSGWSGQPKNARFSVLNRAPSGGRPILEPAIRGTPLFCACRMRPVARATRIVSQRRETSYFDRGGIADNLCSHSR
jgi:hypothetical protein